MTDAAPRTRGDQVRDLIMSLTLLLWIVFGGAAVYQLFTSGSKVLDSLPPFWFWGIPIAPYTAMYAPWRTLLPGAGGGPPAPPAPPEPQPGAVP